MDKIDPEEKPIEYKINTEQVDYILNQILGLIGVLVCWYALSHLVLRVY